MNVKLKNPIAVPTRNAICRRPGRWIPAQGGFHGLFRAALAWMVICTGCGTTTQRTATEQLLLSEAVDRAVNQIDFSPLSGRSVYLDTKSLRPAQLGTQLIGSDYVASALRQKMLAARCRVEEKQELADVIVEARVGALATNGHDVVYGLPASNGLAALSTAIAGGPAIPPIPELSLGRTNMLAGISKIAVFAYDRVTSEPVWQSGNSKFESTARSSWIFAAGPFVRGNIFNSPRFGESNLKAKRQNMTPFGERIPLDSQMVFEPSTSTPTPAEAGQHPLQPAGVTASLNDGDPPSPPAGETASPREVVR